MRKRSRIQNEVHIMVTKPYCYCYGECHLAFQRLVSARRPLFFWGGGVWIIDTGVASLEDPPKQTYRIYKCRYLYNYWSSALISSIPTFES